MRPHTPNRRLFVEQLENRTVPAGMIDAIYDPGNDFLTILGDNNDNHVRVEHVQLDVNHYEVHVSSESGPIRFSNAFTGETTITDDPVVLPYTWGGTALSIDAGNGHDDIEVTSTARPNPNYYLDWSTIWIESGHGNDRVLLDDLQAPFYVSTGNGADLVTMRECDGHILDFLFSEAFIATGSGDDRVVMLGSNDYWNSLGISLGSGDDVLEGDPAGVLPEGAHLHVVDGGDGYDRLLNKDYFRFDQWPYFFASFEEKS